MKGLDIGVLQSIVDDKYVNTNILSEEYDVSIRTIRYSISRIKTKLEKYNCNLLFNNKQGYHFKKQDLIKVRILLEELTRENELATNSRQREIYLSGQIIRSNTMDVNNQAAKLFVSTASVLKDMEGIIKNNNGITVLGHVVSCEMDQNQKFRLITNLIIKESQESETLGTTNLKFLFTRDELEKMKKIEKMLSKSSLHLPNKVVVFQVKWICLFWIVLYGLDLDKSPSLIPTFKEQLKEEEYKLITKYITLLGVGHSNVDTNPQLYKFLTNIENYYNYVIENTDELKWLEQKIDAIKLQLEEDINFKFRETKRYIRLYPYSFSIAQQLLNTVIGNSSYSRHQVAYICDSIQRILFESIESKTILFIVDDDTATANSYSEWILSKYTKNVYILVEDYKHFNSKLTDQKGNIEFLINCTEYQIATKLEVLNVGSMLSLDSLNKIDKMLSVENGNYKFFQKFLSQRLLKVYLHSVTFREVVENSAKYLEANEYIPCASTYVDNCMAREAVGTTYIGYKTMISHPLVHSANDDVLFITILTKPIVIEGEDLNLIINCAFKNNIEFDISRLFELIMKVVENEENLKSIISSQSEMELLINLRNAVIKI